MVVILNLKKKNFFFGTMLTRIPLLFSKEKFFSAQIFQLK